MCRGDPGTFFFSEEPNFEMSRDENTPHTEHQQTGADERREGERRLKSRRAHRRLRISTPQADRREAERRESSSN